MAERHKSPAQLFLPCQPGDVPGKMQRRLAACVRKHFNLQQLAPVHPGAQGLAHRLLGRKPGRIGFTAVGALALAIGNLSRSEHLLPEILLFQGPFHPAHFQYIYTNAQYHNIFSFNLSIIGKSSYDSLSKLCPIC